MDLRTAHPFWLVKNPLLAAWPTLKDPMETDVVVVGAGVTGALVAHALTQAGLRVIVIDKREVGFGSSAASTALIQYEIDTPLAELIERQGASRGVRAYRACLDAVTEVLALCEQVGVKDYARTKSFYYASREEDEAPLKEEFELRRQHDFPVNLWDRRRIEEHFSFSAPAGIMSDVAAQLDVYQFTHALLADAAKRGLQVFDRTGLLDFERDDAGITVRTSQNQELRCRHIVMAAGYESQEFLPKKVAKLTSTFAFVTEPLADFTGWHEKVLLWETARPYLYARTTADGRALFGGEDIDFSSAIVRDALVHRKVKTLVERAQGLFPQLDITPSFAWAGTFAETPDGLPYIGVHPGRPELLFAMCYGGNGIVYSMLAAGILRDHILGLEHPAADLFDFSARRL